MSKVITSQARILAEILTRAGAEPDAVVQAIIPGEEPALKERLLHYCEAIAGKREPGFDPEANVRRTPVNPSTIDWAKNLALSMGITDDAVGKAVADTIKRRGYSSRRYVDVTVRNGLGPVEFDALAQIGRSVKTPPELAGAGAAVLASTFVEKAGLEPRDERRARAYLAAIIARTGKPHDTAAPLTTGEKAQASRLANLVAKEVGFTIDPDVRRGEHARRS